MHASTDNFEGTNGRSPGALMELMVGDTIYFDGSGGLFMSIEELDRYYFLSKMGPVHWQPMCLLGIIQICLTQTEDVM